MARYVYKKRWELVNEIGGEVILPSNIISQYPSNMVVEAEAIEDLEEWQLRLEDDNIPYSIVKRGTHIDTTLWSIFINKRDFLDYFGIDQPIQFNKKSLKRAKLKKKWKKSESDLTIKDSKELNRLRYNGKGKMSFKQRRQAILEAEIYHRSLKA